MMTIPAEFRKELEEFPAFLRSLLDAELAAGNTIVELGHGFPAPPVGAYIKLAKPVSTRARADGNGLKFRDYNSSIYSGEFTDDKRYFFILEPPAPPEPEPDMDAIRAAHVYESPKTRALTDAAGPTSAADLGRSASPARESGGTPLERFNRSMVMDYEKWHDGIGYDMDAIAEASPSERAAIETKLVSGGVKNWRDVEALAALDTPNARAALKKASSSADHQVRLAVHDHAPKLVSKAKRLQSLVKALEESEFYGGLTQALGEAEEYHPKQVVDTLFRGAIHRDGEAAVHFAALLMFIHGKAKESFDWAQRPFFLRFNTSDKKERKAVFLELCEKLGVDASKYL